MSKIFNLFLNSICNPSFNWKASNLHKQNIFSRQILLTKYVLFFRYEWWKNVNGENKKIVPSENQALIEYQEEMIMPLGSALTLGKIEVCFYLA